VRAHRPLRAILFDFDGTILDTETPEFEEWRALFRSRGHSLDLDVWQDSVGTVGAYDPCAHLAELTGAAFDHEALRQEVNARHRIRCEAQPLLPGVVDRAREARAAGLGTAVASSSLSSWVEGWLARHGIRDLFDVVCTRDQVRQAKPAPDLFLLAATRLDVPPDLCVVFEDSPNGIRAARAAGMRCVAIPNPLTRRLPLGEADLVVDSLADHSLAEILERLGKCHDPSRDSPGGEKEGER
jgi:HAD superfamily hydrolase (TIGR01509 family)